MRVDVPSDTYRAEGSVRLKREGLSLLADSVIYRRKTAEAVASGNVVAQQGGDTLQGDSLAVNLDTQTGELLNGKIFVKSSNFRVAGKKIEKTGEEDYHVERGSFTTCDGDDPSWHFEARDLKLTVGGFATGRDALFYLGDIPVFYTPYILFPARKDRQSGLLLPRLGQSTKKGVYYEQPYYWVISPSQDVTFELDLQTQRGAGATVDYRYLRPGGSGGELQGFGIYDTERDMFRGELNQRHLEILSPKLTLASDIHLVADRSYFRDFAEDSGEYNRQLLDSSASFGQRWQRYSLSGRVRYIEDLVAPNNHATLQRYPALNFVAAGTKVGPLFVSMDSAFVNFQRTEGSTGQRLELHPRLSAYHKAAGALDLSAYGGYRELFYSASELAAPESLQQSGQADAGAAASLPLERVYDGKLRHLLIPSLEYGYLQSVPQQGLPDFDHNDRIPGHSALTWALTNVFTRKVERPEGTPEYKDVLYLRLSQGYWFSGERLNLLNLTQADLGHRLSDLMLESRIVPADWATVSLDGRYDPVDNHLSTGNLAVQLKEDGSRPKQVTLGYRYSREELNYLEGNLQFPITKEVQASVLGRYSFDKGGFLESRYSLEYKRQCWGIVLAYTDRIDNRSFTVNFTLAGLGPLTPVRAF